MAPSSSAPVSLAPVPSDELGVLNVVVLCGTLSRPAEVRRLPSGDRLATLQVTTPRSDGPADSVPVVVLDPSTTVAGLDAGEAVVVTGRVRRRFFRAGGRTTSSTEVVAGSVVPARHRRRSAAAVEHQARTLLHAAGGG